MSLSNRINYFRQKAGMTQEQIAEQMNVTRQTVSNWERGLNEPDFASLCRLAEVLGVTLNDFAQEEETEDAGGHDKEDKKEHKRKNKAKNEAGFHVQTFALFLGVLIFFAGGLIFGGFKGWMGSFLIGGSVFMMTSGLGGAIVVAKYK